MAKFSNIRYWILKQINLKTGIIAGLVTGTIVYYINYKHGYLVALSAFGKQFMCNFILSGFNTSLCERLAKGVQKRWRALLLATILPTAIAFTAVYSVHYFLHTPDPLHSTLWQACTNIVIFFVTGLAYHKELERKYKWVRLLISSKKRIEMGFFDK